MGALVPPQDNPEGDFLTRLMLDSAAGGNIVTAQQVLNAAARADIAELARLESLGHLTTEEQLLQLSLIGKKQQIRDRAIAKIERALAIKGGPKRPVKAAELEVDEEDDHEAQMALEAYERRKSK